MPKLRIKFHEMILVYITSLFALGDEGLGSYGVMINYVLNFIIKIICSSFSSLHSNICLEKNRLKVKNIIYRFSDKPSHKRFNFYNSLSKLIANYDGFIL